MSLTIQPNYNSYIDRIELILKNSTLLFPQTIGGDPDTPDLVKQIIKYELPVPENAQGPDPPHVFITTSRNPLQGRKQIGRDSRDAQGPENLTLEFYIVVVVREPTLAESEKKMYDIISALTTTLDKNKRLTDLGGQNPLANTSQYFVVEYLLDTDQKEQIAKNVLLRPSVNVNLR
jgi:hypothetical protein